MSLIVHITTQAAWQEAQSSGVYVGDTLATDGFIHCSTPAQVIQVANERFRGQPGLVLLCMVEERLSSELRYEDCYASGEAFPHIYGPLPVTEVTRVVDFPPEPDGDFSLPALLDQP